MQGRGSGAVREFCLYDETTGETDEFGLPVRYNWAAEYRGRATVVYGHVAVPEAEWLNNTIDIDTGCVFGGRLTALRYPEREIVSVAAKAVYAEPARPLGFVTDQAGIRTGAVPPLSAQQRHDDMLDLADVLGKRIIETRLQRNVIVREENAAAALEVMSRFAADPRWLIYLPPTMSPCEASGRPGLLEHPEEALAYYWTAGVELTEESSCAAVVAWWEELTGRGGEGMVVKPRSFVARGPRGVLQPAVKCRGPEYLRIIYGPEYLAAEHLERLRRRGLKHKRSLALREFALGVEGLERFVRREPLRRVHECVFGVLALESEPVDPRL